MHRVVVTALMCLIAGSALAQAPKELPKEPAKEAPKSPAVVPSAPERTTASFGDWVLRCETSAAPARRVCEVAQVMTVQGQNAPIAQIALGRLSRTDPMRLTLVLPANVTLAAKPKVLAEKDDKSAIDLTWDRCLPGGCIASSNVTEEAVTRLFKVTEPGNINFKDAAGREVNVPLSFRGLSQALAALGKES